MELYQLISANKTCTNKYIKFVKEPNLVCRYKMGEMVDVEIHMVGQRTARVIVNKSDRNGDLFVEYNKASGCIMISLGRNPKKLIDQYTVISKLRGDAHISLLSGKVFQGYKECELDGV